MAKAASMEVIMAERRHEARAQVDLAVQVSGTGANGMPFTQSATASSISNGGALLSGAIPGNTVGRLAVGPIPAAKSSIQNCVGKRLAVWPENSSRSPKAGEGKVSVAGIGYSF